MPKNRSVLRWVLVLVALVPSAWSVAAAPVRLRAPVSLGSIHMITATTGWAVGGGRTSAVLRTTDGGQDWTDVLSPGPSAAAFVDARSARVAVTSYGSRTVRIDRTGDAGAHWLRSAITVPAMSTGSVLQLDFPTRRQGWLLAGVTPGMGHLVYSLWHSSDGGAHWTRVAYDLESRVSPGAFPGCNCLSGKDAGITFRGGGTGWVTGEPFATQPPWLYITHTAGRRWRAQSLPRTGGRVVQVTHAPVFVGARIGYLPVELSPPGMPRMTVDAYVTHDGGRTWRPTAPLSGPEAVEKYVGGLAYSFVAGGQGWNVVHGHFWHTADGGERWQQLHPAGWPGDVSQLEFLNRNLGWAVPVGPRADYVLRSRDGGRTWQRVPTYSLSRPIHS